MRAALTNLATLRKIKALSSELPQLIRGVPRHKYACNTESFIMSDVYTISPEAATRNGRCPLVGGY